MESRNRVNITGRRSIERNTVDKSQIEKTSSHPQIQKNLSKPQDSKNTTLKRKREKHHQTQKNLKQASKAKPFQLSSKRSQITKPKTQASSKNTVDKSQSERIEKLASNSQNPSNKNL